MQFGINAWLKVNFYLSVCRLVAPARCKYVSAMEFGTNGSLKVNYSLVRMQTSGKLKAEANVVSITQVQLKVGRQALVERPHPRLGESPSDLDGPWMR